MTGTCIYDGDCGICTRLAGWAAERSECGILPAQQTDLAAFGITLDQALTELHWVDPDGRVRRGAAAVAAVLVSCRGGWPLLGRAVRLPLVRNLAEIGYRVVARNRHRLPGATGSCRINRP